MDIKRKTLILALNRNMFQWKYAIGHGYQVHNAYRSVGAAFKVYRNLILKTHMPLPRSILGNWTETMELYETIIVFDSPLAIPVIQFIRHHFPKKRVIVWYWNPVSNCHTVPPTAFQELNCELWSFDKYDCSQFGMKYNTQWYGKDDDMNDEGIEIKRDIVFVGADKGRLDQVFRMKEILSESFIKMDAFIIADKCTKKENLKKCLRHSLSYSQFLKLELESAAILDILQDNQSGMSLRPLEAIHYQKKLITNDKGIGEERFYDSRNIYSLENGLEGIRAFLESPYYELGQDVIRHYSFESWMSRFFR